MLPGSKDAFASLDLRKEYGDEGFARIVFAATALWALLANGTRYEFVEQTIAKYAADHAEFPGRQSSCLLPPKSKRP